MKACPSALGALSPLPLPAILEDAPGTRLRPRFARRRTVTLRDRRLAPGDLPLPELLDAALAVVTQGSHQPGDWRLEGWFLCAAIQAVSEAIVACGYLPLPLALSLETHPHKQAWAAMPRGGRLPVLSPGSGRRQPGEPLRFRVRLEAPCAPGEPPLCEQLDAALDVLASGHHVPGGWRHERWFLWVSLRAACEAVLLRDADPLPLPLRVRLFHQDKAVLPQIQSRVRALAPGSSTHPQPV